MEFEIFLFKGSSGQLLPGVDNWAAYVVVALIIVMICGFCCLAAVCWIAAEGDLDEDEMGSALQLEAKRRAENERRMREDPYYMGEDYNGGSGGAGGDTDALMRGPSGTYDNGGSVNNVNMGPMGNGGTLEHGAYATGSQGSGYANGQSGYANGGQNTYAQPHDQPQQGYATGQGAYAMGDQQQQGYAGAGTRDRFDTAQVDNGVGWGGAQW